ncbi:MAG: N-6 DNA methylase, partial [Crenarchaeota archaeon]|nr:N-6 DNA methylase [Thermoproteota archaeon]
ENLQKRKQLLKTLTEKQRKYFDPANKNKKALALEIRNHKIDVLINQLELMVKTDGLEQKPVKSNFKDNKKFVAAQELYQNTQDWLHTINKLKNLKKNSTEPFNHFDWKLDFPEVLNPYLNNGKGGFDIVIGNPPYVQLQKDGGKLSELYENLKFKTFERTGDIYSLFYERGWQLLKNKGLLCYITSNKWLRAGYGESTRSFFVEHTNPLLLIDFGGQKIFESATVDTNILLFSKDKNMHKTTACLVKENALNNLSDYIRQKGTFCQFSDDNNWVILSEIEKKIKEKVEKLGTPLKDWNINIYRGILTGCNEAFIIDGKKKDELISKDQKSAEIIRPILRGRDIKRYGHEFADLYILFIPWHFPLHNNPNINGASLEAEYAFKNNYPAIYNHLLSFKDKLSERNKVETGIRYEWYALQRWGANYWEDFYKQKIMYSEIVREPQFYLDNNGEFFPEATTFIITGEYLEFLYHALHTKVVTYFFKRFYAGGGLGKEGYRYKKAFLELLPVPMPIPIKKFDPLNIENEIINLYQLTKEEIEFIDSQ